jgi:hypothetical protein
MKILRMRAIHRSVLFVVGLAIVAGSALAQPKKPAGKKDPPPKGAPASPAPKKEGDDIEMGDEGKGSGSAAVDPNEIEMGEPENKPGNLEADMAAADKSTAVVKAGPIARTPLSWKDILVVVRKPFLKARRTELYPYVGRP